MHRHLVDPVIGYAGAGKRGHQSVLRTHGTRVSSAAARRARGDSEGFGLASGWVFGGGGPALG